MYEYIKFCLGININNILIIMMLTFFFSFFFLPFRSSLLLSLLHLAPAGIIQVLILIVSSVSIT